MSRKAYDDLRRRRRGLLAWGRQTAGLWRGLGGEDYDVAASYVVRRSNDTGDWNALAPGGVFLASARTNLLARDICQEHYTNARAQVGQATPPRDGSP